MLSVKMAVRPKNFALFKYINYEFVCCGPCWLYFLIQLEYKITIYIYICNIYILQAFQLPVYQIRPKSILFVFCCYTNN